VRVTFTKVDGKRYTTTIERERGPALLPRFAPGYDDLMPHEIAHYLAEECYEIELGVWGQLAAGGGGIYTPAPSDNTLRYRRSAQRIGAIGRSDMMRSERLVVLTMAAWGRSIGRQNHRPGPVSVEVDPEALRRAVRRFGEVADRWAALQHGGSLAFTWPRHLTFDPATSRRGRRTAGGVPALSRR
jgi:hypothetical protein